MASLHLWIWSHWKQDPNVSAERSLCSTFLFWRHTSWRPKRNSGLVKLYSWIYSWISSRAKVTNEEQSFTLASFAPRRRCPNVVDKPDPVKGSAQHFPSSQPFCLLPQCSTLVPTLARVRCHGHSSRHGLRYCPILCPSPRWGLPLLCMLSPSRHQIRFDTSLFWLRGCQKPSRRLGTWFPTGTFYFGVTAFPPLPQPPEVVGSYGLWVCSYCSLSLGWVVAVSRSVRQLAGSLSPTLQPEVPSVLTPQHLGHRV